MDLGTALLLNRLLGGRAASILRTVREVSGSTESEMVSNHRTAQGFKQREKINHYRSLLKLM